jgi:hypothetical protein
MMVFYYEYLPHNIHSRRPFMNPRSFARAAVRAVFFAALAGFLAACAPPVGSGGDGNVRIILGGGARALSPEIAAALSYKLEFSGPGGETFIREAGPGTGSVTLSLALGEWRVSAEARLEDGALYGTGGAVIVVEAGKTNDVAIDMRRSGENSGDWALTLYVSESGSDETGGAGRDAPFATVGKALEVIKAEYAAAGKGWPRADSVPAPARILISGTISETGGTRGMVEIVDDGTSLYANYPPIILAGQGETPAGTLNASNASRVLYIGNAAVTLDEHLTLTGGNSSQGGGVYVKSGTFTMTGGTISGNKSDAGGGVYVADTGVSFIMEGGTIGGTTSAEGNTAADGGGVCIYEGAFTMNGGTISGNEANSDDDSYGGGVFIFDGTFTMTGGTISGNETNSNNDSYGGGVCIAGGTFTMEGGTIGGTTTDEKNTANYGGGVYLEDGIFNMSGGTIGGNEALGSLSNGGGVFVYNGTFTMSGGTISSNSAFENGGGVYVGGTGSSFAMTGGSISGNTAGYGGGVFVHSGTFTKDGGIIYGKDATTDSLKNTANITDFGDAAYVVSGPPKKRNKTAGTGVDLDSSTGSNWGE